MNEIPRFNVVFVKLYELLEEETCPEPRVSQVGPALHPEATSEEMNQIDEIRRSVFEISEPEVMSFTVS